uniref:Uncharacterized protein n=1 Tax=viral metagenome TaxID=1070528 RepID=A0A6C0ERV6_9ZZZZ
MHFHQLHHNILEQEKYKSYKILYFSYPFTAKMEFINHEKYKNAYYYRFFK